MCHPRQSLYVVSSFVAVLAMGADWAEFRGPGGQGISAEKDLPLTWSSKENIIWQTELPGPGASSPITLGNRIYLTCYTGCALDDKTPGTMEDLRRHLLCLDRTSGRILWTKEFMPVLPEHKYHGEGSYHGYSASTTITDGERLYVFFGKSGVYAFDLNGNQLWHTIVGKGISGWGSGTSPVLYKNLLLVNASVESGSMVALDKSSGKEMWRAPGISSAWNTPVLVHLPTGEVELVVSVSEWVVGLDPDTGKQLWKADGVHRYVCPSVIAHDGVVYAIGGGHTSLAVKAGGRGDVTKTHVLWRLNKGSNVSSPVYQDGYLYWVGDSGVVCQSAATGKIVYHKRLQPDSGRMWASPVLADGKIYYVSQLNGTYVLAARPEYELLAHNVFKDDKTRFNGSPAVSNGQILLRSDKYLYCIGAR
jgi:outer membrane protein assembly factor BamB